MPNDLRTRLRAYSGRRDRIFAEWMERGCGHPPPSFPPLPDDLRGLACGAKTRKGTPCKRTDIYRNGRCKLHGGLSTGPKTAEGKRRSAANLPGKPHEDLTKVEVDGTSFGAGAGLLEAGNTAETGENLR